MVDVNDLKWLRRVAGLDAPQPRRSRGRTALDAGALRTLVAMYPRALGDVKSIGPRRPNAAGVGEQVAAIGSTTYLVRSYRANSSVLVRHREVLGLLGDGHDRLGFAVDTLVKTVVGGSYVPTHARRVALYRRPRGAFRALQDIAESDAAAVGTAMARLHTGFRRTRGARVRQWPQGRPEDALERLVTRLNKRGVAVTPAMRRTARRLFGKPLPECLTFGGNWGQAVRWHEGRVRSVSGWEASRRDAAVFDVARAVLDVCRNPAGGVFVPLARAMLGAYCTGRPVSAAERRALMDALQWVLWMRAPRQKSAGKGARPEQSATVLALPGARGPGPTAAPRARLNRAERWAADEAWLSAFRVDGGQLW